MRMSINQEMQILIPSVVVTKNKVEECSSKKEVEAIKDLTQEIEVRVRAVTTTITIEAIIVEEVSSISNINNNLNRYL